VWTVGIARGNKQTGEPLGLRLPNPRNGHLIERLNNSNIASVAVATLIGFLIKHTAGNRALSGKPKLAGLQLDQLSLTWR